MVIMTMRMKLTKSLMKLEKTDYIKDEFCDTTKDDMKVQNEANVY